ncbi:MAG: phosphoribosyl-AMP cyclohydrolase [Caldilineaceae bacterium SB0662_bin_9]|uniref:Phosphoribosyl-AMP cyclohydrolase n=1 Tax=Caldilineaceae bacterium SB0662_bin_9 TaxID=2605258 RepID=A0A6B1DW79_9CHLR|nr:phosphoribosyl-AMP cyclohydrolase [Caldilineaceae bacterium SB0662_bin_9]
MTTDAQVLDSAEFLESVKFDAQGLVTAVVQDANSLEVLMVAWMNREALERTTELGQAVFWSRSRRELWHKGATSGHFIDVEEILVDCDGDTLVLLARPHGPACHTGARTCFFRRLESDLERKQ